MSLDVYLVGETTEHPCYCPKCDNEHVGHTVEEFFSANITHNLGRMAIEAGIYNCLWRPDEVGVKKASQLIIPLQAGLNALLDDRPRFEKFDSANGWGTYRDFVPWVKEYLLACVRYPDANVRVSR